MRVMTRLIAVLVLSVALFSTAAAQECAEEVMFEVYDGTIAFSHNETQFNCCAWIDVEITLDGYHIEIVERERFEEGPCFCLCCFDVGATIAGLEPGEYTVDVWKAFWVGGDVWTYVHVGTWVLEVEGQSNPSLESYYIPCVETGADELPFPDASWGTIKGLYR
jgi:hypothetical protein